MYFIEDLLKKLTSTLREDDTVLDMSAKLASVDDKALQNLEILRASKDPAELEKARNWIWETYDDYVQGRITGYIKNVYPDYSGSGDVDEALFSYILYDLFWKRFLIGADPESGTGIYAFDEKITGSRSPFLRFLNNYLKSTLGPEIVRYVKKDKRVTKAGLGTDDPDEQPSPLSCIMAPVSSDFDTDEKELACDVKNVLNKIIDGKIDYDGISAEHAKQFLAFHALGRKRPTFIDFAREFGLASAQFAKKGYDKYKAELTSIENEMIRKGANKKDIDDYARLLMGKFSDKTKPADKKKPDADKKRPAYYSEKLPDLERDFKSLGISDTDLADFTNAILAVQKAAETIDHAVDSQWVSLIKNKNMYKLVADVVSQETGVGKGYDWISSRKSDIILFLNKLGELVSGDSDIEFGPLLEQLKRLIKSLTEWEAGGAGAIAAEPDELSAYDTQKYVDTRKEVEAKRSELERTDSETVKMISDLRARRRPDRSLSKSDEESFITSIYQKYDEYVKNRILMGSLAHGFDVADDIVEKVAMEFWEGFLFGSSPSIFKFNLKTLFITFLDASMHSLFIRDWLFGREKDKYTAGRFAGVDKPSSGIRQLGGKGKPSDKAAARVAAYTKADFDEDELDMAKDIAKLLIAISSGEEKVGNVTPKDADLFMHYFGIKKPKLSYPDMQKELGITYHISQAVNDTIFKKDVFGQLGKKLAPTGDRREVFERLATKIKDTVKHSSRHGECVFACF